METATAASVRASVPQRRPASAPPILTCQGVRRSVRPKHRVKPSMRTIPPADEDEEFDFSYDSSEISQQVDRLDTFLSGDSTAEPEVASLPENPLAEEKTVDEDQPEVEDTTESLAVTADQIDSMLERVIKDKLGGKIETIIYEVIEKAVSKEIDRLKGALLDDTGPGNNK